MSRFLNGSLRILIEEINIEYRKFEFAGKTYEMDEYGNVKSLYKTDTGFKKCFPDKDGYLKLSVKATDKRTYNAFIHRLVYEVWVGAIPAGYSVDHIDNNKLNNHHSNFQLLTMEENAVKGNAKNWTMMSPTGEVVHIYNMAQFCREHNLHAGHMSAVCNKKPKHIHYKGWTRYDASN